MVVSYIWRATVTNPKKKKKNDTVDIVHPTQGGFYGF
jgi:hypothetical protein